MTMAEVREREKVSHVRRRFLKEISPATARGMETNAGCRFEGG
jgi:hypothetical protein